MKKLFLVFLMSLSLLGAVACETAKQPNSDTPPTTSEDVGGSNSSPEGEKNSDGTIDLPMDEF